MKSLSKQLHITATDSAQLMQIYQKSFPYASLEGAQKLLVNIQKVVGSNTQAIQEMTSKLGDLVEKYPELEKATRSLEVFLTEEEYKKVKAEVLKVFE
jgi:hypothetical protein